jgi:hypothetical protein
MNPLVLKSGNYIKAKMASAAAVANPDWTIHYANSADDSFEEGNADGVLNGTSLVTFLTGPATGAYVVKSLTVYNSDSAPVNLTIQFVSGGGTRILWKGVLAIGDTFTLNGVLDNTGSLKTVVTTTVNTTNGWSYIPASLYTTTPASTSTLTMTGDLTATVLVGMSLKYDIGGTTYYGMVGAIASNLLTIWGAPLSGDVSNLYFGGGKIREIVVAIPGTYEDASNTSLINSDLNSVLIWELSKSYLVHYTAWSKTHDSAAHGQASVRINNTEVNTTAGGVTIAADATQYATVVDIAIAAYDINLGELIEITAVKGGTGDAANLVITMTFVTP